MVTWQTALQAFVAICVSFTSVCVAMGWLVKIVKGAKKPADDFKSKLDNDNKRIKDLEDANKFMYKAISLLLQDDLAILEHLRTNNSTGKMAEQEKKVQEFLIER